ncbi:MAG TPA: HAD family hydrolase, partial [Acidimicrobiales bacterium]|nr:HAD family hydrolase [Acidimicrobiales bacterium]
RDGTGEVRLVATDLDGTLLGPEGRIGARTRRALAAARQAGIAVVPVTGRPPQALWPVIDGAELGPLAVCSNGAVLVDLDGRRVLEVQAIAGEVAVRLIEAVRQAVPGVLLATDNLDDFTYEQGFFDGPVEWEERLVEVEDIAPTITADCLKLIGRRPGWTARQLICALEVCLADEARVTTSGLDWVDIGALQVTKAWAMDRVCQRLGIGVHQVVAVGDNHNDLPVLAWAATAMAPANAIAEVRALASRILPSNAEEGVAVLLEELVAGAGAPRSAAAG